MEFRLKPPRTLADNMGMTYNEAYAAITAVYGDTLPGGARVNAAGLMAEYGYPLEGAVKRAVSWVLPVT